MGSALEELAASETPMGLLTLRRRLEPSLEVDAFEVNLGNEYLMSSQFTAAEIELARLGLAEVVNTELDVVVGGLGLGYTATAALLDPRVRSSVIVEALSEVIDWHRDGLLPEVPDLTSDPRTRLVHGDFVALAGTVTGFDPETSRQRYNAILVDIDHSPRHVLSERHRPFYTVDGLRDLTRPLHPGGVFALWSDDPRTTPSGVTSPRSSRPWKRTRSASTTTTSEASRPTRCTSRADGTVHLVTRSTFSSPGRRCQDDRRSPLRGPPRRPRPRTAAVVAA